VQLVIKDNGPGLAPGEAQPLLQSTAVSGSRTGLGMHIIRDLAQAIGCTIRYESAPQAGTAVYLVLN
jgi:C4-dicarboxylate-specific signal transduction histidine kinase